MVASVSSLEAPEVHSHKALIIFSKCVLPVPFSPMKTFIPSLKSISVFKKTVKFSILILLIAILDIHPFYLCNQLVVLDFDVIRHIVSLYKAHLYFNTKITLKIPFFKTIEKPNIGGIYFQESTSRVLTSCSVKLTVMLFKNVEIVKHHQ